MSFVSAPMPSGIGYWYAACHYCFVYPIPMAWGLLLVYHCSSHKNGWLIYQMPTASFGGTLADNHKKHIVIRAIRVQKKVFSALYDAVGI